MRDTPGVFNSIGCRNRSSMGDAEKGKMLELEMIDYRLQLTDF
jgi:hypothetical protein